MKEQCELEEKVKKIVVEHLGVEADKVTEEASFIDDLGADSLDIVELNPFLDERGKTAKLLVDLVASLMGKRVMDRPTVAG